MREWPTFTRSLRRCWWCLREIAVWWNHERWRCWDFMREKTGQRGPYQGHFAATLEYLPSDYTTDPHLTLTVGRRLTPFNMYSERFTTLWIRSVQDALIVYLSGTRASGSRYAEWFRATGGIVNYAAYFLPSTDSAESAGWAARPANQWIGEAERETKRRRTAISAKLRALKQCVGSDFAARG